MCGKWHRAENPTVPWTFGGPAHQTGRRQASEHPWRAHEETRERFEDTLDCCRLAHHAVQVMDPFNAAVERPSGRHPRQLRKPRHGGLGRTTSTSQRLPAVAERGRASCQGLPPASSSVSKGGRRAVPCSITAHKVRIVPSRRSTSVESQCSTLLATKAGAAPTFMFVQVFAHMRRV